MTTFPPVLVLLVDYEFHKESAQFHVDLEDVTATDATRAYVDEIVATSAKATVLAARFAANFHMQVCTRSFPVLVQAAHSSRPHDNATVVRAIVIELCVPCAGGARRITGCTKSWPCRGSWR